MRIVVLEDNEEELKAFKQALHDADSTLTFEWVRNRKELMEAARKTPGISLCFMDIYLEHEYGIDCAQQLKKVSPMSEIIFLTSSSSHAIIAFNMHALHYILKPVTQKDIQLVLDRVWRKTNNRATLILKNSKNTQILYLDEISTICSNNHFVRVTLNSGASVEARARLCDLETQLNKDFLKLQRGMIVHASFIKTINRTDCTLKNDTKVLLTRANRKVLNEQFRQYLFRQMEGRS